MKISKSQLKKIIFEVMSVNDALDDLQFQPDDLKLFSFVKKEHVKDIMYHGMPGIESIIKNEDLLNDFYPSPSEKEELLKLYDEKNMKLKGPMVFFQLPDLQKIRELNPNHPLVSGKYLIVEIDYDELNDFQGYDGIYGLDLLMYDSKEKERMLTPGDVNDLSVMAYDDAWRHYVPDSFAKNVPHGIILTDNGIVDPSYLKIYRKDPDEF